MLDGFPVTREQWAGMLQNQLIPDCVISLQDNSEKNSLLVQRVCKVKGIDETTTAVVAEGLDSATGENVPESVRYTNTFLELPTFVYFRISEFIQNYSNGRPVCRNTRAIGHNCLQPSKELPLILS